MDKRLNEKYGFLRLLKVYIELGEMRMEKGYDREPYPQVQRKKCGPIPNFAPNRKAQYVLNRLDRRCDSIAEDAEYDMDAIQRMEKCALCGALIPESMGECQVCKHES